MLLKDKHDLEKALPELHFLMDTRQTSCHFHPPCVGCEKTNLKTIDEFEDYMLATFIPHVNRVRKETGRVGQKSLVLIDGHSSRLNLNLWVELARHSIIAVCLPAHISHKFTALDLTANRPLKTDFSHLPKFPSKTMLTADFPHWIRAVFNLTYRALSPETVSEGFELAYIKSPYLSDAELRARCHREVLDNRDVLPLVCPDDLKATASLWSKRGMPFHSSRFPSVRKPCLAPEIAECCLRLHE